VLKKLSDAIDKLSSAQNMTMLQSSLSSAVNDFGFVSFNFAWNKRHAGEFMEDPLLTTWSKADLETYSRDRWAARDPLLKKAVEETTPFLWTADAWQKMGYSEYAEYLKVSGIHGGITIPLGQEVGQLSAMTLLTVTDTPLSTENLHVATTLTRYVVARTQVLREGIDAAKPDILRLQSLSSHQMEILHWVSQGKTNREIAVIVGKSRSTIDYHLEEIRRKMGVLTRAQAAVIFTRAKLNGALSQSYGHC